MVRQLLLAACALALMGAARPPSVDYRFGIIPQASGLPLADVEIRFHGDADGETTLDLPDTYAADEHAWRFMSDLKVDGASVTAPDPAHRVLRHKPNAKITVRYRVQSAYDHDPTTGGNPYDGPLIRPDWMALLGDYVFATPAGRDGQLATFAWGKLPKGWKAASDLEHGRMGRFMSVADAKESLVLASPRLTLVERPITGGTLRMAGFSGSVFDVNAVADETAKIIGAERAFWNDQTEPFFVGLVPLAGKPRSVSIGGSGRGDAFVLYASVGEPARLHGTLAHELTHTWIPARIGRLPSQDEPAYYWLSEGFTDFYALRTMVRGGQTTARDAVAQLNATLAAYDASPVRTAPRAKMLADFWKDQKVQKLPYQRGMLLALKWDDEIRRKSGGKLDLDDVVLRMRDHYQRFPAGQGPDVVTGLISAAWVVAGLDLRPDIAKYADGGAVISFPETLMDNCLDARVTVSPGFDSGFDHVASLAAKKVMGVRRLGPAWNSGLRNGMAIDALTVKPGDMTQEIQITVRDGKKKPKAVRYWPYGDNDVEVRKLALAVGLSGDALSACGRKLGGL